MGKIFGQYKLTYKENKIRWGSTAYRYTCTFGAYTLFVYRVVFFERAALRSKLIDMAKEDRAHND